MLRFDYTIQNDNVNITIVEETRDTHSLCGRIVLSLNAWINLTSILQFIDTEKFKYKFNNKNLK